MKQKVLVHLISNARLLVHEHVDFPEVGIQVPGGTIEAGESTIDAAIRELREESGIESKVEPTIVGQYEFYAEWDNSMHFRTVVQIDDDSIAPLPFEFVVTDGELDKGIRLMYSWMPLQEAIDLVQKPLFR